MSVKFFVLATATLLVVAACQTPVSLSPKAIRIELPGSAYLHDPNSSPIHIGDGRGQIDDIPAAFRTAFPPARYGWKFVLPSRASGAELEINMFSLVEASNPAECHTHALLNGASIAQLNTFPGAGSGSDTLAKIAVPPEALKVGENLLEIVEAPCTGREATGALNDSLIRSVRVTVQ